MSAIQQQSTNRLSIFIPASTLPRWVSHQHVSLVGKAVAVIVTVIGLVLTGLALRPAFASTTYADVATALAQWTARKDFIEFCESHEWMGSDCLEAKNASLAAPPGFSSRFLETRTTSIETRTTSLEISSTSLGTSTTCREITTMSTTSLETWTMSTTSLETLITATETATTSLETTTTSLETTTTPLETIGERSFGLSRALLAILLVAATMLILPGRRRFRRAMIKPLF
ncbi:hypothetical protein HD806DRAFT_63457 [Xylariaceae sp. AK1471]|nr:hypothetical protein HD806DRAFT_63457 [Xylariaceae sp. AK1471]